VTPAAGAASAQPPAREQGLMSIGEVLSRLRADFPDTTISKLRFLEAEGLIEPQRTPAGYRKYSWSDLTRLRYILTAQRDQYLPLRVIRAQLHAAEAAGDLAVPAPGLVAVAPDRPDGGPADARLGRAELLARAGIASETLDALEQHGLVAPRAGGRYDADALAVARAAGGLGRFGLEPRHLRGFRSAADREVGLVGQLVAPLVRQHDPAARARADQTAHEVTALIRELHAALVRAGLRDTLGG
jgi:DNA-binding transcriptional MerR regulator